MDQIWIKLFTYEYLNLKSRSGSILWDPAVLPRVEGFVAKALANMEWEGKSPKQIAIALAQDVNLNNDIRNDIEGDSVGYNLATGDLLEFGTSASIEEKAGKVFELKGFVGSSATPDYTVGDSNISASFYDYELDARPSETTVEGASDKNTTFNVVESSLDVLDTQETYLREVARINKLVEVPRFFRDRQTLQNLEADGWIEKVNPVEADEQVRISESTVDFDEGDPRDPKEVEKSYIKGGRELAGDARIMETAFWVFTEKGIAEFEKAMLNSFYPAELAARGFEEGWLTRGDAGGLTDEAYALANQAVTLLNNNRDQADLPSFVFEWTGDDKMSPTPEGQVIEGANFKQFFSNHDQKMIADMTGLSPYQVTELQKAALDVFGSNPPWQLIALAIDQNNDYVDASTGLSIIDNRAVRQDKFAEYISHYDDALNIYQNSKNGDVYYELAYLHLMDPALATKIFNGKHSELTVGETRVLREAYNTLNRYHQTGDFSPGWSADMPIMNWLQKLPAASMSTDYYRNILGDEILEDARYGSWANLVKYQAQQELEEAAKDEIDDTMKATTREMYKSVYQSWFMDEPTDAELDKFEGWFAGKESNYRSEIALWSPITSNSFLNPDLDPNDPTLFKDRANMAVTNRLRSGSKYQTLYGRKPAGMTEEDWKSTFEQQAQADYGASAGSLNIGLRKKAMEAGDPGVITRHGIVSGEGYDNSQYMRKIMSLRNAFRRNT